MLWFNVSQMLQMLNAVSFFTLKYCIKKNRKLHGKRVKQKLCTHLNCNRRGRTIGSIVVVIERQVTVFYTSDTENTAKPANN